MSLKHSSQRKTFLKRFCTIFLLIGLSAFLVYYSSMFVETNAYGVAIASIGGVHDMVDFTNKSILARENVTSSNLEIDRTQVFVPLSLYLTRGQEPANCATNRAACKIDINCMQPLKNIILTEPATCKILDFKRDIRGCMAKGWCPEEDIYNPEITYRKVSMTYTDLNLSIANIGIFGQDRLMNLQNNHTYPSRHANKFNIQKIMDIIGFHLNALNRVGAMIEIRVLYVCQKFFILAPNCQNSTIVEPHDYFGETTGFSFSKRPEGIVNYTSRDLEHHVGINIYTSTATVFKEFSVLSFFTTFLALIAFMNFIRDLWRGWSRLRHDREIPIAQVIDETIE